MSTIQQLLTDHLDIWTRADNGKKSGRGRSSNNANSVYGIKKLRELILELAVRGKLVPQDPNDEPARELLKKIHHEKAQLIKKGVFKKQKPKLPIIKDEKQFDIPNSWEWCRLDDISPMPLIDGDWIESKDQDSDGGIRLIQLADVGVGEFKDKSARFINQETFERLNCTQLHIGDILIARLPSPIGRACLFPGLNQMAITVVDVAVLRCLGILCEEYAVDAINSKCFRDQVETFGKGATRFRVATGDLKTLLIPIPPIAEQRRIVAKVDELMLLCDQMETKQNNAVEAHEKLVNHLLSLLIQSQNSEEFSENWQCIAAHFDMLFTTEASIDALKQTLLQLAVMGKLVPQDPNDEPANELLKRIKMEKANLINEGKIRKAKTASIGNGANLPDLPQGWEWTTLANVCIINPRNSADDNLLVSFVPMTMIGTAYNSVHDQENRLWKEIKQGFTHFAEGDVGVAKITPCFENSKACVFSGLHNGIGAGTTELHIVRIIKKTLVPHYILAYLKSSHFLQSGEKRMTGTAGQKRIPKEFVESNPFPLPPLAEQRRIVARIDELMQLCDRLKSWIIKSNQFQQKLADVIVESSYKENS